MILKGEEFDENRSEKAYSLKTEQIFAGRQST